MNRNTNVNSNTNVNRNTNVNVNRDVDIDVDNGCCGCCYNDNPLAKRPAVSATVAVTAAVIRVDRSVGASQLRSGRGQWSTYQQCGSTWYQPQMSGGSTTYVVVNAP